MIGEFRGTRLDRGVLNAQTWGNQMQLKTIEGGTSAGLAKEENDLIVAEFLAAAANGETAAYFDLGVAFSTGSNGAPCDLIEAHKWFNLAAAQGHEEASWCRADVSDEMTAREIAEAQRRARRWLAEEKRQVA